MTTKNFKRWDTFYNSNGYLCLVYEIKGGKAKIVNYNGTFYSITVDGSNRPNYNPSIINVNEFFNSFPMNKIHDIDDMRTYQHIIDLSRTREINTNLLLLC